MGSREISMVSARLKDITEWSFLGAFISRSFMNLACSVGYNENIIIKKSRNERAAS